MSTLTGLIGGGGGGAYQGRTISFTSSTTYTAPANIKGAYVMVIGGGGGGGLFGRSTSGVGRAGGGGGGGVAASYFDLTPSQSYTVSVGGWGGAQLGTGNVKLNGNAGGTSSFAGSGITTVQATGGGGGAAINESQDGNIVASGGAGGVGSGGNLFNYTGGAGGDGAVSASTGGGGGGACNILGVSTSLIAGGDHTDAVTEGGGFGAHPCGQNIIEEGANTSVNYFNLADYIGGWQRYNQVRTMKNNSVFGFVYSEIVRPNIPLSSPSRIQENFNYYDGLLINGGSIGSGPRPQIFAEPFCGSRGIGSDLNGSTYPFDTSMAGIGGGGGGCGFVDPIAGLTVQSVAGGVGIVHLVEILSA